MIGCYDGPRCRDKQWYGAVGADLSGALYVDYTSDDLHEKAADDLAAKILSIIGTPLPHHHGDANAQSHSENASCSSSSSGLSTEKEKETKNAKLLEHLGEWSENLDITPDNAATYARTLIETGSPSDKSKLMLLW